MVLLGNVLALAFGFSVCYVVCGTWMQLMAFRHDWSSSPHKECEGLDCVVFGLDLARVAISSVHMVLKRACIWF